MYVDALSKLASNKYLEPLNVVAIGAFKKPFISKREETMWIEGTPLWTQSIMTFFKDQMLPEDKEEAHKLRCKAVHFVLQHEVLYKRIFSLSLL